MYKLLIVDDEAWVRERLSITIDWGTLGVEVVGTAEDGEEALSLAQILTPDIIITDIRMPSIDGLEFINCLNNQKLKAKTIIISGYNDFEYAQRAIKLGALDYILKPIDDNELINVVLHSINKIKEEERNNALLKSATTQLRESMPLLREKFYINLINGYFKKESEIIKESDYLNLDLRGKNKVVFVINVDNYVENENWDMRLLLFVICNIAKDFINKVGTGEAFFIHSGEVICLLFSDTQLEKLERQVISIANAMKIMINKVAEYSVTIGIGGFYSLLSSLHISYQEAKQALGQRAYIGISKIYNYKAIDLKPRPNFYKLMDIDILINHIKMGNKESAQMALKSLLQDVIKNIENVYPLDLKLIYIDLMNSIFKSILDANTIENNFSDISMSFFEYLNKIDSFDSLYYYLSTSTESIMDSIKNNKNIRRRKIVEKAIEYIEQHYREPLTLNNIADKLYLNPSYFCKIFKDETGEPFTRYLINYRLQKAMKLMEDPTKKIYEIAEMVGYENIQYFNKIFKSMQGVSPLQYREKVR